MPQTQTIEYDAKTIALAEARQKEAGQETETEEESAAADYAAPAQKRSVGTVEFFFMVMLAFVVWLLSLIPYLGILFSFFGVASVALWYKMRHLNPPTLRFAQPPGTGNITAKTETWIEKLPGGSDFLFFLGVFSIDAIPFINLFPALPGLVFAIYLANRD